MTASHYMSALRWTFDVVSLRDMLLLRARPTYRAILGHVCLRVHSSISASSTEPKTGMSRQLEKKDFGPSGFRWLTLKRIVVCILTTTIICLNMRYVHTCVSMTCAVLKMCLGMHTD